MQKSNHNKSKGFYQGIYKIKRPNKYMGKNKPPVYRSNWEAQFCAFLDNSANVRIWDSEPDNIKIFYHTPDLKQHRYHPDFYVEMKNKQGIYKKYLVEIKPFAQSPRHSKPKEPKRKNTKRYNNYLNLIRTHITNGLKWDAAEKWCEANDCIFLVLSEKELGITK